MAGGGSGIGLLLLQRERERGRAGEPGAGGREESRSGPARREVERGDRDFETPAVPALWPLGELTPHRARTSPVRAAPGGDTLLGQRMVPSAAARQPSAATRRAWGTERMDAGSPIWDAPTFSGLGIRSRIN